MSPRLNSSWVLLFALGLLSCGCCSTRLANSSPILAPSIALQEPLEAAAKSIQQADFEEIAAALEQLDFFQAQTESDTLWVHRWQAILLFHLSQLPVTKKGTPNHSAKALSILEGLRSNAPLLPDPAAMQFVLLGQEIKEYPVSAWRLGPKTVSAKNDAERNGADSPRVAYLLSMAALRTAKTDEDLGQARDGFDEALERYANEAAEGKPLWEPQWGEAETYYFLGETQERLGNKDQALYNYRQAAHLRPQWSRAQQGIDRCLKTMENP